MGISNSALLPSISAWVLILGGKRLSKFLKLGKSTTKHARSDAKFAYTTNTPIKNTAINKLRTFCSLFIQHLSDGIPQGFITPQNRVQYNIDENDGAVPNMVKEQSVMTWAMNIKNGEAARVALGGVPLTPPSAAEIEVLRLERIPSR